MAACSKPGADAPPPLASGPVPEAGAPSASSASSASSALQGVVAGKADVIASERARIVLFREAGRARAIVARSAADGGVAVAFDVAPGAKREPVFPAGGLTLDAGADAEIVPLLVRPDRAWFSVVEHAKDAPKRLRVRLVERDGRGAAKVVEEHEVSEGEERRPSLYDRAGKVAVVALGDSVYGFTRQALVLAGPGAERAKFEERPDTDCPANKRCFLIPPIYDLSKLVGVAPNGSFVTLDRGIVLRVDRPGVTTAYGHESYAAGGVVADGYVTLLHGASEPPEVTRWSPPAPPPKAPSLPQGKGASSEVPLGTPTALGRGPFTSIAEDGAGDAYALRKDGGLVKLTGASAGPLYEPADGCRAVDVVATGEHAVAWVVRCEPAGGAVRHVLLRP